MLLSHATNSTDHLKPCAHINRHLHSNNAVSTLLKIEGLGTKLRVQRDDLDVRIVIKVLDDIAAFFLTLGTAKRDNSKAKIDELRLDIPSFMLATVYREELVVPVQQV